MAKIQGSAIQNWSWRFKINLVRVSLRNPKIPNTFQTPRRRLLWKISWRSQILGEGRFPQPLFIRALLALARRRFRLRFAARRFVDTLCRNGPITGKGASQQHSKCKRRALPFVIATGGGSSFAVSFSQSSSYRGWLVYL